MRLKELRGLPVIDPTAARKVGLVIDYQVDPALGRLAALDVSGAETAQRSGEQRIEAQRVRRVGRNAVILTERGGPLPGSAPEINEQWLDLSTLAGLEVMGDDGNLVGHLVDAVFDQDSLAIEAYLLRTSWWERLIGRGGRIEPEKVHSCSRELMMLTTGHVKELATADDASGEKTAPLKAEDRAITPGVDQVADREAIPAPTR